jgi:hypothetical protein
MGVVVGDLARAKVSSLRGGAAMDVRITVETTFDNGEKRTHQLDGISRPYQETCPDGIGLRLEDGKRIIEQIQRVVLYD